MIHELQIGDVIRYRYDYDWEYRILTSADGGGVIKTKPPPGTRKVIQGCWKKDVFHPRKIINIKP